MTRTDTPSDVPPRQRLRDARLYLVTDSLRREGDSPADLDALTRLHATVAAALDGGVDVVQFRDKGAVPDRFGALSVAEEIAVHRRLRDLCHRHGALYAVNDRADVALAVGADVVHVGQDDVPVDVVRRIVGPDVVVGLSCHTPGQVDAAAADPDVDYFCTGPVWTTPTKPGRAAVGTALVRHGAAASRDTGTPFFAIGGIDAASVGEVVSAGARRIVVVRAVAAADDPAAAARTLRTAVTARD
ncbi:thiamine phosphate synthase [Corynebacterium bovis]|uniref:thiamine phosphate synthase n=1 Tax=Corynebacterium bovis TaxID=36808 RepID=UPI00244A645F|nr:thiamine phosphate synthase [Corynebacterium bovis]MDH2456460.1 thiamine phosphate synthase [Corynebacterium bovis]